MTRPLIQPSFAAGELAPALWGRIDLSKYHVGLRLAQNMFIHAQGGASNRVGTRFLDTAQNSSQPVRLIRFQFSSSQAYCLEFGHLYMRVIKNGGYVQASGGGNYSLVTPYAGSDIFALKFAQKQDVMTITHPSYSARDLGRLADNNWTLTVITFASSISAPSGLISQVGSLDGFSANTVYKYVITALNTTFSEESIASSVTTLTSASYTHENVFNILSWNALTGAAMYNIYATDVTPNGAPATGALFGYIGSTSGTSFNDIPFRMTRDFSKTPPQIQNPLLNNNPAVSCYFQQRKMFGASNSQPNTIWGTQIGNFKNMNTSFPIRDGDSIQFTLVSNQLNAIKHLIPLNSLIAMTSDGAWKINGGTPGAALTPSKISAEPQAYVGASDVPPIVVGADILYIQAKGNVVRDLTYNFAVDLYTGQDISVLASHLFFSYQIVDWAYAQEPFKLVWAVRDDGTLLSLTYLKEHDVIAWTRHITDGLFLSVCTVPEGDEDAVYLVVQRTVGITTSKYIERMASRDLSGDITKSWFVDCGLQYIGSPTNQVTGLQHLNGKQVAVLGDGKYKGLFTVSQGKVTLQGTASVITAGLPYTARAQTLPLNLGGGEETIQSKRKQLSGVTLRLADTSGFDNGLKVGPTLDKMKKFNQRPPDPGILFTGDIRLITSQLWQEDGSMYVEQADPLPLTVLAYIPEVRVGDTPG